jgi:hypothetical protein
LDTIAFDLAGRGVHTIAPAAALPTIIDPVVIDGSTQPGFGGRPLIDPRGPESDTTVDGLTISAGASTVRGLVDQPTDPLALSDLGEFDGFVLSLRDGLPVIWVLAEREG